MISIIVPVWNHCHDLTKPFIETILAHTLDVEFELIVVNNGSKDDTARYLRSIKDERVRVVSVKENIGFGGANNLGYSKAKGEYICFISNDVLVTHDFWLQMMKNRVDKEGKVFIGQEIIDYNTLTTFRHTIIPYLAGYLMFGTRAMFQEILDEGMVFDEHFGPAYFEDVELSYRATLHGYKLVAMEPIVNHLGSKTTIDQMNIPETTKTARVHYTNKMMMYYLQQIGKKRIVFYFKSTYPFTDSDLEGKGVGGSESALIFLSRAFARAGYLVDVYNTTTVTGVFNGVNYHNISEYVVTDYCDVFILFRTPFEWLPYVNAASKIFWSCDQYTVGYWNQDTFPHVDKVVAISPYHKKYLEAVYGHNEKLTYIDLGVNIDDYKVSEPKVPGKMIYCSVPRRGLKYLVTLFPDIQKFVPNAELFITSDYRLWGQEKGENGEFIRAFEGMKGVHFLGKISRQELIHHQKTAELLIYPCDYEECFCLSALECIAAGAVPVTTNIGALETTVGEAGVLLSNTPGTPEYDRKFLDSILRLMSSQEEINRYRLNGIKNVENRGWDQIATQWTELFNNLQKSKLTMVACEKCGKTMKNGYILGQHIAKFHGDKIDLTPIEIKAIETTQKLLFKRPIEIFINGIPFVGTEVFAPFEYVDEVIRTARSRYGSDILDL